MISFSTVEFDGHTYDAELLAAPLRAVQARAGGTDRREDRLALVERALALRSERLHGQVGSGRCSCGLLLPADQSAEDAEGHLDLATWLPTYTFVVRSTEDEQTYVAVCGCGWRERHAGAQRAHDSLIRHATESATPLRSVVR